MIKKVVETWHRVVAGGAGRSAGGRRLLLGDRLHPTARQGRYDDLPPCGRPHAARRPRPRRVSLHEAGRRRRPSNAEFEATIVGKYVNGVDIICCDDTGHIAEFRVMSRPLRAINE